MPLHQLMNSFYEKEGNKYKMIKSKIRDDFTRLFRNQFVIHKQVNEDNAEYAPTNDEITIRAGGDRVLVIEHESEDSKYEIKSYFACNNEGTNYHVYLRIFPVDWSVESSKSIKISKYLYVLANTYNFVHNKHSRIVLYDNYGNFDLDEFWRIFIPVV